MDESSIPRYRLVARSGSLQGCALFHTHPCFFRLARRATPVFIPLGQRSWRPSFRDFLAVQEVPLQQPDHLTAQGCFLGGHGFPGKGKGAVLWHEGMVLLAPDIIDGKTAKGQSYLHRTAPRHEFTEGLAAFSALPDLPGNPVNTN